ncbi:MAG: FAD binding domain-containing protein [Treponema sp.]|jgi:CO/xanthine dehydrogenase FAD-binding subunit|nr:FAD binding domain-containing protein [Treponema sp.]
MGAPRNQVFFPTTFQTLFSHWFRTPDAVPFAGGTDIIRYQGSRIPKLPQNILSLDKLEELHRITRTERYLEIGAMVKLSEIIALGKIVPEALTWCLEGIGGPQVRNLATIGGNICRKSHYSDASVPMIALDAQYELRTATATRWISASRFSSCAPVSGSPARPVDVPFSTLGSQELLTRIRIPLEQWDYGVYTKFTSREPDEPTGGIVFIIRNQKNVLTDIRIIYGRDIILRDKNTEALLIGKPLPLNRKDAFNCVDHWKTYLAALPPMEDLLQARIINFIESSLLGLTD